jgi:hypothetical protein
VVCTDHELAACLFKGFAGIPGGLSGLDGVTQELLEPSAIAVVVDLQGRRFPKCDHG